VPIEKPDSVEKIDPKEAVIEIGRQDTSTSGECLICKAIGWIDDHPNGLPYGHKKADEFLTHTPICTLNPLLDEDGNWVKA
jgi:hypothetical protein